MSKVSGTIALLFLLTGGTGGCAIIDPNPEAVISGPAAVDTSADSGEEIYLKHCVGCHGTNGVPLDIAVGELRNYAEPFSSLDVALNTGPGSMPIYPYAKIDSAQRRLIYAHILTFR